MQSASYWNQAIYLFSSRLTVILMFAQLLWCPSLLMAQVGTVINNLGDQVTRPIPGAGHDYIHGLSETVNPENGTLSIKIDLPVPTDRGFTIPYAITYNSGEVYNVTSLGAGCGGFGGPWCASGTTINRQYMGWSDTYPYATYSIAETGIPPYSYDAYCWISNSYNFYDPSGQSHMLGLAGISELSGTQDSGTGYTSAACAEYATYNNTWCFNSAWSGAYGCSDGPLYQAYAKGGDDQVSAQSDYCTGYYQAGGSNPPADCSGGTPAFTVTDLSGTTYFFPVGQGGGGDSQEPFVYNMIVYPTQIEDRNGNVLQVSSTGAISDTLGRSLFSPWSPSSGGSGFTVAGLNFGTTWTTVTSNFSETLNTDYFQVGTIPPSSANLECTADFSVSASSENVLQSITLPNGQSYQFGYDPTYGLVNEIIYPDGGWVKYQWALSNQPSELGTWAAKFTASSSVPPVVGGCNYQYKTPVVVQRTVGYSPNSAAAITQTFGPYKTTWGGVPSSNPNVNANPWAGEQGVWSQKTNSVATTDNVIGETSTTSYTYNYFFRPPQPNSQGQTPAELPLEQQIVYTDWNGKTLKTVNKTWADQYEMTNEQTAWSTNETVSTSYVYNPYTSYQYSSYAYGFPEQLEGKQEYDYGQSSPSRITTYGYYTFTVPSGATIAKPNQVIVTDGNGNHYAENDAVYDGQAVTAVSNLPQGSHDETNYSASSTYARGNPTKVISCTSGTGTSCSGPTTIFSFDETGQVLSMTDPCGNSVCSDMISGNHTTTYSYGNNYTELNSSTGQNVAYSPSANTNAFVTQITDPLGYTQKFSYDFNSSYLTNATDENSQPTNYVYNDSLNRLTSTTFPDGGQTLNKYIDYSSSVPNSTVTTCKLMNGSQGAACSATSPPPGWETSVSTLDGMGHVVETQLASDPYGADNVLITYNGEGQVYSKTNPFRGSSPPSNSTTYFYYDVLGRTIEQQNPDGTTLQTCYNDQPSAPAAVNCTALLNTNTTVGSITGTWDDSTDENGNHWQRASDAFGRLTQVEEPNGASQSPTMATSYTYDPLNNLRAVTQWGGPVNSSGSRSRSFQYDWLSRLTSAANPETGTVGYTYDLNGNVLSKTDARSVTTSYSYNVLNQLLGKSYSNDPSNTPSSCFQYGTSTSGNTVERLINEWTQSSLNWECQGSPPTNLLSLRGSLQYDAMGRLVSETQKTPLSIAKGTSYPMTYTYNLTGDLTSTKDGTTLVPGTQSNVALTSCFDQADRLQVTSSNWTGSTVPNDPADLFVAQSSVAAACANGPTPSGSVVPYAPFGGLWSAYLGNNVVTVARSFDNRLRVTSEYDTSTSTPNTNGSAVVTITGTEQSQ
jgi:YD repeat-containing protein